MSDVYQSRERAFAAEELGVPPSIMRKEDLQVEAVESNQVREIFLGL